MVLQTAVCLSAQPSLSQTAVLQHMNVRTFFVLALPIKEFLFSIYNSLDSGLSQAWADGDIRVSALT